MKKILLMLVVLGVFFACSDEEVEPGPVVKMNDKTYLFNMPKMSTDTAVIKAHLRHVKAAITEEINGETISITANIASKENDLFSKVVYTIKTNGNRTDFYNVNLFYNNVTPDEAVKLYVKEHLDKTCVFNVN